MNDSQKPEQRVETPVAQSRRVLALALAVVEANHEWHIDHDDHDGYPESEIGEQNIASMAALRQELARLAPQPLTAAANDLLAERRRQVEAEGYDTAHDDEHDNGSMAEAAAAYAYQAHNSKSCPAGKPPLGWPWDAEWWKPGDPRRMLVKAGALILAEIERLDREAFHTAPLPSHDHASTR